MDLGVDRYGRPTSYTQTSPYTQRRQNNPANQQPDFANQPREQGGVTGGGQAPAPPQPPAAPQPNWNTDGFARPQYTAQNANQSAMAGWDQGKWASQEHQTPKYVVGRILSQFSPSIEGLGQAMSQIQQAYPGATFNGKDKITIPGVGTIDVLTNSSIGQNMGWAWQTGPGGAPASAGASMGAGMAAPTVGPGSALSAAVSGVGRLPTYAAHQFQQRNAPVYQPGQIDQFQGPDFSQFQPGQDALISQLLANPESMGTDTVNQMKASQSEASARMVQDAVARMQQNAVGRGAVGGLGAGERRLNEAALSDLLGRFRDIDIQAAQTNFDDRLRTLGAVDTSLGQQLGRATLGYETGLRGQLAREDAQRAAIQSALDAEQFGFQRELAQADENRFAFGSQADQIRFDLQKALGEHGMAIDAGQLGLEGQRLNEMIRQFNANFGEGQRQFNAGMGLSYNQLAANQQQALINQLLGGYL